MGRNVSRTLAIGLGWTPEHSFKVKGIGRVDTTGDGSAVEGKYTGALRNPKEMPDTQLLEQKTITMTFECYTTNYGFRFGSAEVERMYCDEEKQWVMIGITTPKHPNGIQVYVTKTGKVRIFSKDGEWEAMSKK